MADIIKDDVKDIEVIEEIVETTETDKVVKTVEEKVVEEKLGEKTERLIEEMRQQLEVMKAKNTEPSPEEIAYQEKVKELWTKEMNLELKQAGLSDFAEFFFVEEGNSEMLQTQIKKFKDTLSKRELNNSFVPSDHKNVDKYSLAEKNKDTKSMIGSKLSKFFK